MKEIDQAIHTKANEINSALASSRLKSWDRFYQRLSLGILITGQSGLIIMAMITWANPNYRIPFSTLAIYEACILSAFVLAAFANDRVTRRYKDMQISTCAA